MTPSARSRACTAPLRSFLSGRLAHSRLAAQRQFNHGGSSLPAPLRLEPRVSASPRVQRAGPGRALGARLTIELSMPRDTRGIRRVRPQLSAVRPQRPQPHLRCALGASSAAGDSARCSVRGSLCPQPAPAHTPGAALFATPPIRVSSFRQLLPHTRVFRISFFVSTSSFPSRY